MKRMEFLTKMDPNIACDYVWNGDDELECGHIVLEDTAGVHKLCTGNLLEKRPTFCPLVETSETRTPDLQHKFSSAFKTRLSDLYQEAAKTLLHKKMHPIYEILTSVAKEGRESALLFNDVDVAKLVAEREGLDFDISSDDRDEPFIKIWGWS